MTITASMTTCITTTMSPETRRPNNQGLFACRLACYICIEYSLRREPISASIVTTVTAQ